MNEGDGGPRAVDVVVVGAGQAGVSVSYYLKQYDIDHVVLERDQPFSAWRDRWDGFMTNTTNRLNTLPMLPRLPSNDPDGFASRDEMVRYFEECLETFDPPVESGVEVLGVSYRGPYDWEVKTDESTIRASHVVICTGAMSRPHVPGFAGDIPSGIAQMHSNEFRNVEQIPTTRVLLVGGGSSGVQICRILVESGRFDSLHLSASKVPVLPRRVLGIQTHRLIHALGLFDLRVDSMIGRFVFPRLESSGDPIVPPTPRQLAKKYGVLLHPRLVGWEGGMLRFEDSTGLDADDLTIVWCTGLRGDYRILGLEVEIFDELGRPCHERGIIRNVPGLSFVGLRHQHTIASHDVYGVGNDAHFVAARIRDTLSHKEVTTSQ